MSIDQTPTRPVPSGRYAAPNPAPNTPTECPRCGSPAISTRGVALHDLDHRRRDELERRQEKMLERLQRFLDSIETNVDASTGQRLTLSQWIEQTDHALDDIEKALSDDGWIRQAITAAKPTESTLDAAPAFEVLPWPGETHADPDDDLDTPPAPASAAFPADEPTPEPDEDALAGRDDDLDEPLPWSAR